MTHRTVPKLKAIDAVKAAFDPHDDPMRPPKQSVSEQQVRSQIIPGMHGLRLWDAILGYVRFYLSNFKKSYINSARYFMEENSKRAAGYLKDRSDRAGALEERKAGKDAR